MPDLKKVVYKSSVASSAKSDPKWGKHFHAKSGFSTRLDSKRLVEIFVDDRFQFGDQKQRQAFIQGEKLIAYIRLWTGHIWEVKSESLNENAFGLIIYSGRKAVAAGTGQITKAGYKTKTETLYSPIRFNFQMGWKTVHTVATASDGSSQSTTTETTFTCDCPAS